jgi:transposase
MTIRVRALTAEETSQLTELARSRTRAAGLVRRAQIVLHAVEGLTASEIAARMELCCETVRFWLKRFNERGLAGLAEDMRSGRRPTYSAEEKSAVIRTALTRPTELGLPFACWTLDRLVAYLSEQGIGMRRSRLSEILLSARSCSTKVSSGARRRHGSANVSIPTSSEKGGDRATLYGATGRQRSHLPG